jgi:membrane protease YdiL (CAAX protease family)
MKTVSDISESFKHDNDSGRVSWGPLGVAVGILVFLPVLALVISARSFLPEQPPAVIATLSAITTGLFIFGAICGPLVFIKKARWAEFGIRLPSTKFISSFLMVAASVTAFFAFGILYGYIVESLGWSILELPDLSRPDYREALFLQGHLVIVNFIVIAVWTPICEEILFRGFIYGGLRNSWGQMPAAIFSAILFSLIHLHLGLIIPVFIMGMILTLLYMRTKSIWPCILVHAINNAVTLTVVFFTI